MGRSPGRPGRRWPGLLLLAAFGGTPAAAQTLSVPAVPYIPQSEALCGGAALAMVLRYWGVPGVRAEDFAGALNPDGTGIPTASLRRLSEARGFEAIAFSGGRAEAVANLEKGRPLIALLVGATPARHHYVVVLAWANQRVLVHDPAVGPFRILSEAEWQRRWEPTGRWALLVLPPADLVGRRPGPVAGAPQSESPCAALLQPAVELAQAGSPDSAREHLAAAAAWCPNAEAPVLELASLEFRRESWSAAADLAAEAVRRDPSDKSGWKLLATSQFLANRREQALAAWNRIHEPRLDLVQIDGFERTPSRVVYEYLGEEPSTMLTPERFRRVQRRVDALPAVQSSRVSYRPLSGGTAQLDVKVVERPAFSSPASLLLQAAARAVSEQAIGVDAFALAASGDSVRLLAQWQPNRAHGAVSVSAPHFLGLPGIATAEALWDEQAYRLATTPSGSAPVRERRERGSLSIAHWWAADTRGVVTAAVDQWTSRGRYVSLAGDLEQRLFADHVAVSTAAAGWWSNGSAPFYVASSRCSLRTRPTPERTRLLLDAVYELASARAPLALWAGAGTGAARALPLRAHSLVHGGVIDGAVFGRQVFGGSAQLETPLGSLGPARLRAAAFVDLAKLLAPAREAAALDIGAGLRLRPPGWRSSLRLDVATPWGSARPQLSVGWQSEWP